jgi:hypothetical protein
VHAGAQGRVPEDALYAPDVLLSYPATPLLAVVLVLFCVVSPSTPSPLIDIPKTPASAPIPLPFMPRVFWPKMHALTVAHDVADAGRPSALTKNVTAPAPYPTTAAHRPCRFALDRTALSRHFEAVVRRGGPTR